RFVAKQFNLAGRDNLEQAKVDSVVDTIVDLMEKIIPVMLEKDEQKKQKGLETFQQEDLPKQLQNLETLLTNYGQTGLVKIQDFLDKYPKLKRNQDEVQNQPRIAAYLKARPQTLF
ncbi:unnamed protein product, partial [Didymodactylos carnosus]